MTSIHRIDEATRVIRMEAQGLRDLCDALESDPGQAAAFSKAVDIILSTKGYLIVVGVGKSGHIGQKLAASFASTGTPAFFMHPTEASHGDLGMVTAQSAVLAISKSGESREMVDVLHFCSKNDISVIGLTRNPGSTLGQASTVVLQLPDSQEACINGLAPTTSTTNTLALGDALVVTVMAEKGVSRTDFGRHHPGGKLGRGLQSVGEWIRLNPHTPPTIKANTGVQDVVLAVSAGQNGCIAVVDNDDTFLGMITDGDLRRAMKPDMFNKSALEIMTAEPTTLHVDMLMSEVVESLIRSKISNAFVLQDNKPIAVVNLKVLMVQGYV